MPHRKLEFEIGNRTPNCLRHHVWLDVSTFNKCLFTTKQGGFLLILICKTSQIFVWRNKAFIFFKRVTSFPAPKMEPERTCGISCLRSLAPMWRFAMQHHPGNIHQSFATPRYSATPCYVLLQLPNVIDTMSKRWQSKKAFNTSPCQIFSQADSYSHPVLNLYY